MALLSAGVVAGALAGLPVPAGPAPPALPPEGAARPATAQRICPRCGYRCDGTWRHCASCGWDLRTLTGPEAARRLEAISRSVVGLVVVKDDLNPKELLPTDLQRLITRYRLMDFKPGRHKAFATAFSYGGPGLFVTSARVLERASAPQVRTYNNRLVAAEILGYDIPSGIGLLRADLQGSAPLQPAESEPATGEGAWAICYPVAMEEDLVHYLPQSLHRGRITATGQSGTSLVAFENLLRTDHTLPGGCTGGPLIDLRGGLAGTLLGGPSPSLAYAVPAGDVGPMVEIMSHKTRPQRVYFGMGLVAPDDRQRARFGLEPAVTQPLVAYVVPGSPAESSGVRPGDIILAVRGQKVATVAEAGARLLAASPGSPPLGLTLLRAGQETDAAVAPGTRPDRILLDPVDEIREALQANLVEVTTGPTSRHGLLIKDLVPGGRGAEAGYKNGDTIVRVYSRHVRRFDTFRDIIRSENGHIFGEMDGQKGTVASSAYIVPLEVRTEDGKPERRTYFSLLPDLLAPPVY